MRLVVGDLDSVGDAEHAHGPVAGVVVHGVGVVVGEERLHAEHALGDARDQRVYRLCRFQLEQVKSAARRRVQTVLAVARARAVPARNGAHERLLLHVPHVALLVVYQRHLLGILRHGYDASEVAVARELGRRVVHVRAGVRVVDTEAVAALVHGWHDQEQSVRRDDDIAVFLHHVLELVYLQRARQLTTHATTTVEGDLRHGQILGVVVGQQNLLDVLLCVLVDYLLLGHVPQQDVPRLGADDVSSVGSDGGVRHDGAVCARRESLHQAARVEVPNTNAVARRRRADVCVRRQVELLNRLLVPVDRVHRLADVVQVPDLDRFVDRRGDRFVQLGDAPQRHHATEVYVERLQQLRVSHLPHVDVLTDGADDVLLVASERRQTAQLVLARDVSYVGRQLELRHRAAPVGALLRHVPQLVAERQRRQKVGLVVRKRHRE